MRGRPGPGASVHPSCSPFPQTVDLSIPAPRACSAHTVRSFVCCQAKACSVALAHRSTAVTQHTWPGVWS